MDSNAFNFVELFSRLDVAHLFVFVNFEFYTASDDVYSNNDDVTMHVVNKTLPNKRKQVLVITV